MSRAFTISFDFEGKTYLAFASVTEKKEEETSYFVRLYDDNLYRIIPDGNVCFTSVEGCTKLPLSHPSADRLMNCISQSISDHLLACKRR